MGVRGLTSFIEANDDLLKRWQLQQCRLVIDGDNLIYYLHWLSSIVNSSREHIFGGTPKLFGKIVRSFFNNLNRCNVEAILVMDGGSYLSNIKENTTIERLNNLLRQCRAVSRRGIGGFSILPMLYRIVFKDIAIEMKVTIHQSTFEADNDILAIANHYKCPVLSNDSDFFIFDLKAGFIPLKSFNFFVVKECSTGGKQYFIDCKLYEVDNLIKHFPGLEKNMLLLFSCLVGNDYVEAKKFERMLNSLPNVETKLRTRKLRIAGKHEKKMIQLLDWMRHKDKSEVITSLLSCLKTNERVSALNLIDSVLNVYGIHEKNPHLDSLTGDRSYVEQMSSRLSVPVWFLEKFNCGLIDSSVMNVLTMNRLILVPQVEDFSLPSCYNCSSKLQCFYFQILRTEHNADKQALLLTRNESGICRKSIDINCSELQLDSLDSFCLKDEFLLTCINSCQSKFELTRKQLQTLAIDVNLKVKSEELNCLLHLIKYWLQETNISHVYLEFIIAFIASIVYNVSTQRKRREQAIDEVDVKQNFQKFLTAFIPNNGNQFEARIVHLYNELQSIVLFFTRINSVLSYPLPHIRCENVFDGILLYNLTKELYNRTNPLNFIVQKLGTKLSLLFNFIYNFVLDECLIERKQTINMLKSKKKKKKKTSLKVLDLSAKFSLLEVISSDEN